MQAIIDTDMQAGMDEGGGQEEKLPGRGRQAGWQWQEQRGRLADSPQASRQTDKQPSRQGGRQSQTGRQVSTGRQADEIRQRGKFW
jgi:hypothetical protein